MARVTTMGLTLAVLLGGCLSQADGQRLAAAQAQFFSQWQAGQYGAIYDGAAPELTGALTRAAFIATMQHVDQAMGACQPPAKQLSYHFVANPKGYFASQSWRSACAKGQLDETVAVVVRNGAAQLAGFSLESPQLPGFSPIGFYERPSTDDD
jgi:hypothetical protein